MRRLAALACAGACGHSSPPGPIESHVAAGPTVAIWQATSNAELFAGVGDTILAWDQARDGVVERSARTGVAGRFRSIARATVNGTPEEWLEANGGIVIGWGGGGDLTFLRSRGDALEVAWTSPDDWWGAPYVIAGNTLWGARARGKSALEAVNLDDGTTRWSTKFPIDAQDVKVGGDASTILLARERYLKTPPNGPADIHRVIAAYDAKTGAVRWEHELPVEPNQVAVGEGGAIAALDDALVLFDATGTTTRIPFHHAYPSLVVDRGIAYVVDHERGEISAHRTSDGHAMWRTARATGVGSRIEVHGEQLYVTTSFGTVIALDRTTGAVTWEIGTGVIARYLVVGDTAIVTMDEHDAAGFVIPRVAPAPETATIHGVVRRVACGRPDMVTVGIGDQRVTPDANGHFTATVSAIGVVLVTGATHVYQRRGSDTRVAIALTGSGDYATPDLEYDRCDIE